VIEVLRRVRQRGNDVHLHILGGGDTAYVESLRDLQAKNRDWVFLEGWVGGAEKARMVTGHRFGISGRKNEPFGIAVAEMVKAGCIVFVPNGGGQVEIVDHPSLVFDDEDEAVDKICSVLEDTSLRPDLRAHLAQGMDKFSVEAFQEGVRQTVKEFFEQRSRAG
jgi:glycosyltransferase involved in cell wall biosynthesis